MSFSLTSFLATLLFGCIMIFVLYVFLSKDSLFEKVGCHFLLIYTIIISIKFIFPIEFVHSINIPSKSVLPNLLDFLQTTVFSYRNIQVRLTHVIMVVWISGALYYLKKIIINYIQLNKIIQCLPDLSDDKLLCYSQLLTRLQQNHSFHKFKIVQTKYISTPAITGFITPTILLPEMVFSETELEFILSHELNHYYSHDIWWKAGLELLCSIYWWNPFMFILRNEVNKLLELRADSAITIHMNENQRIAYLECLVRVHKSQTMKDDGMDLVLAFNSKCRTLLAKRAVYILNSSYKRRSMAIMIICIMIAGFSTTLIFEPYTISPQVQADTFTMNTSNSYLIKGQDDLYSYYVGDKFYGTIEHPDEGEFYNLPLYENIDEVKEL